MNLIDFHVTEIISEERNKVWKLYGMSEKELEKEKEVKKYLRSPKNYTYKSFDGKEEIYGFDALVKEVDLIIKWQEWSRCGYEMGVCYKFETDCKNIMHMDCYEQAHMNIEMIIREVIRQYKEQKKAKDGE